MPPKLKNKAKMIYMPAEEVKRLVAQASKSGSSEGSRYSTPAARTCKIPAPKGSAGRSGDSRPGYNLEEVLMLTKEQHTMLRLTVQRFVYKYCDVTKLYNNNKMGHKASVISCCLEVHPWLSYYEDEWPVTVIMRQILLKTSHNYRFEDWGDEELLEKMEELKNAEDSEENDIWTPLPKARATKSSSPKSSSKSSSVNRSTKSASFATKTPNASSSKKKAAAAPVNTYESNTQLTPSSMSKKSKVTAAASHPPKTKPPKVKKHTKKRGTPDELDAEESNAEEDDKSVVADQTDSDEDDTSDEENEDDEDGQEQEEEWEEQEGEEWGEAVVRERDDEEDEPEQPPTPSPAARPLPATRTRVAPTPTQIAHIPTPTISIATAFASQAPPPQSKLPTTRINTAQKAGAATEDARKGKGKAAAVKPAAKASAAKARTYKRNADNANILDENADGTQAKRLRRGGN